MDLPLSWLESFEAVVEERHFGRAASRLHRSPSAVSRHVQRLEAHLGTTLLRRTSRQVHLTEAGRALYADSAGAVEVIRAALCRAAGTPRVVRVGYVSAAGGSLIPRLVGALGRSGIDLALSPTSSAAQVAGLLDGEIEVGVQWAIGEHALPAELATTDLRTEALAVALPIGHRLAGFPQVELSQLADVTWIMAADTSDHLLREGFVSACRARGFSPRVNPAATGLPAQLAVVAAGRGVCMVPLTSDQLHQPDVAIVPLAEVQATLIAVTRTGSRPDSVDATVTALRRLALDGL